ncbi:hypothetical protein PU634_01280 [Oceanimonas pelagia]|uniref:Phage shock protein A n=1 Tax=Oceanimonas pelagia TaxID=3028314 RepID=A0AA50KMT7_9GAMM|nr:hypothetical protein [Oceanimonas pelagia]WMC11026.1 hypothetical protein PU634_01280 [Oceanimonas pelagia]
MSVLGRVLRSLQDAKDGSLDSERVCVQLVQDCRHAEQHMTGLARQCDQLKAELAGAGEQSERLAQRHGELEQAALAALDGDPGRAHALAQALAELENEQEALAVRRAYDEKRLAYYRRRWLEAERHYHDLCRQLAMARASRCVRQTMAAIREHPAVTLINAKQALAHIRAREQQVQPDEPAPAGGQAHRHSADEVLARLRQQRNTRP